MLWTPSLGTALKVAKNISKRVDNNLNQTNMRLPSGVIAFFTLLRRKQSGRNITVTVMMEELNIIDPLILIDYNRLVLFYSSSLATTSMFTLSCIGMVSWYYPHFYYELG